MAIRERQLFSLNYVSGGTSRQQIPRDAVFHLLRLGVTGGSLSTVQGGSGTGPQLAPGFPFNTMRQIRIIRNGSDIVWSGSGDQLAMESFYLNNAHAMARLYTLSGQTETLRTAVVRGVTVPANSQGIGSRTALFTGPDAPNATGVLNFDMQADLMFQVGVDDDYFATLVDARPLADYAIEIDWNTEAAVIYAAGTANTTQTLSFAVNVLSVDQDNVQNGIPYGTFKRSQYAQNNIPYGSENNQVLLPRGNMLYGLIMGTRAFKAGSASVALPENNVLNSIELRINTNLSLKKFSFAQMQANNIADHGGRQNAFDTAGGAPQGYGLLPLTNATQSLREALPTFAFDQLDLQLGTFPLASARNGTTTSATNPLFDMLIQEVIPGVSVSPNAPQGAQNGSINRTSAKPFGR